MILAAIDTTGERLTLALADGGTVRTSRSRAGAKHLDDRLLPALERLTEAAGIKRGQIQAFAAASGPGRFTGIRIGMTSAAALAAAFRVPVVAVSLFEACARRAFARGGARERLLMTVFPGVRGELYYQTYSRGKAVSPPAWVSPEDWPKVFGRAVGRSGAALAGPAANDAAGLLKKAEARVIDDEPVEAVDLLPIALERLKSGAPGDFSPLYLKPAGYERLPKA